MKEVKQKTLTAPFVHTDVWQVDVPKRQECSDFLAVMGAISLAWVIYL